MSVQTEHGNVGPVRGTQDRHYRLHGNNTHSNNISEALFRAPVMVTPDNSDSTTQQIQSKLGNYHLVKHLLDEPKRLIGIEGVPASPAPQHPGTSSHRSSSSSMGSSSRPLQQPPQEFKKPGGPKVNSNTSLSSSTSLPITCPSSISIPSTSTSSNLSTIHHRSGFVKPSIDGKGSSYGARTNYSLQPIQLPSNKEYPNLTLTPNRGQSTNSPGSGATSNISTSRLYSAATRLPRLPLENVSMSMHSGVVTNDNNKTVESILKEMTVAPTPITGIAQTPREETEPTFTLNATERRLRIIEPVPQSGPSNSGPSNSGPSNSGPSNSGSSNSGSSNSGGKL
ncbi:hypothetical protein M0804_010275 [Polistes exclamans]|nr:hypothetical protein M0804_010275 [Polistes exclamans]